MRVSTTDSQLRSSRLHGTGPTSQYGRLIFAAVACRLSGVAEILYVAIRNS